MGKKGKKKGKGKGKDKGGKKKDAPPPPKIEEEPLDESSREFYLIQIRDLEQRVTRYQAKCDTLTVTNEDLQKKLTQQVEDQEHIISLLKKKMQEQTERCLELEDQLSVEKSERQVEVDKLTKEMALIKEEAQDRLDQLVAENTVLHGTLDSLEEFKLNKERIEGELAEKERQMKKQKMEFEEKLYQLEKQAVLDKDRLRKEMVMKVNSVASEFRKVSDLQMADTTKRTIQENISVTQQLHRMSDKTAELIRENEKLKQRERDLMLQLEMMEANERDMTRKNVSNQKILVMMKDRIKDLEEHLRSSQGFKEKFETTEKDLNERKQAFAKAVQQAEEFKTALKSKSSEYKRLQEEYAKTKDELESLKSLLMRTTSTIKTYIREPQGLTTDELLSTLMELLLKAPHSRGASSASLIGGVSYQPGDLNIVPKRPVKNPSTAKTELLPPLKL